MYDCRTVKRLFYPYLDGELDIKECLRLQEHLQECAHCRALFNSERRLLHAFRTTFEVPRAPDDLEDAIRGRLASADSGNQETVHVFPRPRLVPATMLATALAVCIVVIGGLIAYNVLSVRGRDTGPNLMDTAVIYHDGVIKGEIRLDIVTSDPARIVEWLEREVDFPVVLPLDEVSSLELTGARLVNLRDEGAAALLIYNSRQGPVSLLMTKPSKFKSTGEKVIYKNIEFYPGRIKGYYALSWTDSQLSYVLVSDRKERIADACRICHGGDTQHDFSDFKNRN